MSWRLVHLGGRPCLRAAGSNGSSAAHCASVRSCRFVTATLATRSPCRWVFLVDRPSTGAADPSSAVWYDDDSLFGRLNESC